VRKVSTSTFPFLDVSVWVALAHAIHPHHSVALAWAKSIDARESFLLCRVTQLGLLRMLTERSAMGPDVLTQAEAWIRFDQLVEYWDAVLLEEPFDFTASFRARTTRDEVSPKHWADAYLAAFAEGHQLTLVTFDRALAGRVTGSIYLAPSRLL
jgi:toxin-antitoxin system PIN domain toxin